MKISRKVYWERNKDERFARASFQREIAVEHDPTFESNSPFTIGPWNRIFIHPGRARPFVLSSGFLGDQ